MAARSQRGTRPDVLRPDAVLLSNLSCTSKKAASGFVPSSSPLHSNAAILSPFLATQALAGPVPVALSAKSQLSCASSAMTMTLLDVTRTHSSFVSAVHARTSSSSLSVMGVVVAVPRAKTWSVMSAAARDVCAVRCKLRCRRCCGFVDSCGAMRLQKLCDATVPNQEYSDASHSLLCSRSDEQRP